jgi:hypothetical protein
MLDIEAVEAMNFEQIATPTDRVLLRARRAKQRLSNNKIVYRPEFPVELAQRTRISPPVPHEEYERTVAARPPRFEPAPTLLVRAKRVSTSTASAAVLASIFAVALAVTTML